jgi:hypothetical protein
MDETVHELATVVHSHNTEYGTGLNVSQTNVRIWAELSLSLFCSATDYVGAWSG